MRGIVVAAAIVAGPSEPDVARSEADALADAAEDAYDDDDLERAVELSRQAYALEPRGEFLFMWAQAELADEHCERALPIFREFLTRGSEFEPEHRSRVMRRANEAIAQCEAEVERSEEVVHPLLLVDDEPPDDSPPATAEPSPDATPRPTDDDAAGTPEDRPHRVDPLGLGLVTAGGVVLLTGGALGSVALYDRANATGASTEGDYARQVRREPVMRWTGIGLMSVGAALVVGGVVRLVQVRRKRGIAARWLVPQRGGLAWGGRF